MKVNEETMAILTVSREFGSGGREIGRSVADALAYEYIDRESILEDIRAAGEKWEEWGKGVDEHCPTIWEKYDWSFRGFGSLLQSAVLHHAVNDRVVIIGMGANFLLKGIPHALRIHVVAPLELKIERVMKRDSVDRKTAQWMIEKKDGERSCFIRSLYGRHWEDPDEYDHVFDMETQSIEAATSWAKDNLAEKDRFNTDAARELLQMRAAAARIKAGLFTNPSLFVTTMDVVHDGEHIILRGVVHTPKERKRIEDAVAELGVDLPLRSELHYRV
jgi:cytidylate kinase